MTNATGEPNDVLPKVAIISATPLEGPWATSQLMSDLFAPWPKDKLCLITVERRDLDESIQQVETLVLPELYAKRPNSLIGGYKQIQRFLNEQEVDVVYFRSAGWPMALEMFAMFLARRRHVVTHVMDDWPEFMKVDQPRVARLAEPVFRSALRSSVGHFAISTPMAEAFEERYGVTFAVAHCGLGEQPPANSSADNQADVTTTGPANLLYSGTIASEQTEQSLIDIAASVERIRTAGTDVTFTVVPASRIGDELRGELEKRGAVIGERGNRDEYLERLRSVDIVVATSNFDERSKAFLRYSMPNKTAELLACGTPILAYGPAGIAWIDAANAGSWAQVADTRDPQRLDDAVLELLSSTERRADVLAAAAEACATDFSLELMQRRVSHALLLAAG